MTIIYENIVVGAGPAGLTAAYELSKKGRDGVIVEETDSVGGLARTIVKDNYRFDIGAHRFFTKVAEIDALWEEILGEPLRRCSRLTRILYRGKFYDYPLNVRNVLRNLGFLEATLCFGSYVKSQLRRKAHPATFEDWVVNEFGERLFKMFFKSYTEKVWGCSCREIGADWAAQRIKGLNFFEVARNAIFPKSSQGRIKTLIDEFKYPARGAGHMWESCAQKVLRKGWTIDYNRSVYQIEVVDKKIRRVDATGPGGQAISYYIKNMLSSMPLRSLLKSITPTPPVEVMRAAEELAYRDFLMVTLILDRPNIFPDNWIYVHNPDVRVARIDNFGNWTPEMLPQVDTSCIVMEYFVFEGDKLWLEHDDKLVEMAFDELNALGLDVGKLIKGYVTRVPKAYPVYDTEYKAKLLTIREWLKSNVLNLQCIGRNGQHRYNNQDHSMATALIAARNLISGESRNVWSVNEDAEYHEIASTERGVPTTPTSRYGSPP